MNAQQLAALLNGREYRNEITDDEAKLAKADGLVVVFGASDDLMELRGAIYDEAGCYDGGSILIDTKGVTPLGRAPARARSPQRITSSAKPKPAPSRRCGHRRAAIPGPTRPTFRTRRSRS